MASSKHPSNFISRGWIWQICEMVGDVSWQKIISFDQHASLFRDHHPSLNFKKGWTRKYGEHLDDRTGRDPYHTRQLRSTIKQQPNFSLMNLHQFLAWFTEWLYNQPFPHTYGCQLNNFLIFVSCITTKWTKLIFNISCFKIFRLLTNISRGMFLHSEIHRWALNMCWAYWDW